MSLNLVPMSCSLLGVESVTSLISPCLLSLSLISYIFVQNLLLVEPLGNNMFAYMEIFVRQHIHLVEWGSGLYVGSKTNCKTSLCFWKSDKVSILIDSFWLASQSIPKWTNNALLPSVTRIDVDKWFLRLWAFSKMSNIGFHPQARPQLLFWSYAQMIFLAVDLNNVSMAKNLFMLNSWPSRWFTLFPNPGTFFCHVT